MRHSLTPLPRARTRTVYLDSGLIRRPVRRSFSEGGSGGAAKADHNHRRFGGSCSVVRVSLLVRAIVDHVCTAPPSRDSATAKALFAVLRDQLPAQRELPLFVPTLTSPLALGVAAALASDPADTPRIRDLSAELGVSNRTLERAFIADAGMPLGEWRQRARISHAIALLAAGGTVQDIALEVGYATASAFVAVFKKYVGTTPGKI